MQKVENKKVENKKVETKILNLQISDALKSKLEKVNVAAIKNEKQLVYKYNESFTKIEINGEKGKNFRAKCRKSLQRLCNNIFFYAKTENVKDLNAAILAFKENYKENYLVNDFSLQSFGNAKSNVETLEIALQIIKEMETKK